MNEYRAAIQDLYILVADLSTLDTDSSAVARDRLRVAEERCYQAIGALFSAPVRERTQDRSSVC